MRLAFLPEAREELREAVAYYERKEEGLGDRFRDEVSRICRRIAADPCLWRERPGGYRRVNLPVFTHYVVYFVRGDTVIVAAVAHGHRLPGYWKERLP